LLGFKAIVVGRKVLDSIDDRLKVLPRMRTSKMLGPSRFARILFTQIMEHRP
jgi:hypothetical protein